MATEYGLWKVFEKGDYTPATVKDGVQTPKPEENFNEDDRRLVTLNSKAILMLQSALSQQEYFRICTLPSAKAMWDALEIAHEGTTGIKENRVNTLMTEYDLLRMKSGESIGEFQLRFTHLINQLSALGKIYEQKSQVRKILNILTKDWEAKVTAIEEARGESMSSVAALFGSLSEYEGKLKFKKDLDEANNSKGKGIILKAVREKKVNDDEEEDDELSLMVRKFKKLYKQDQEYKKHLRDSSSHESKKPIVCFECGKPGHIKPKCPQLDNNKKRSSKLKKAYVSAIWGDSSSDEDEADEEDNANICLVTQEEKSEDEEVNESEPSFDELYSEYNSLYLEFRKIAKELIDSKRKIKSLEQAQTISVSPNFDCEKISEKICENCCVLDKRNVYLTKTLEKFTQGSEMLNVILKQQRFTNDKSGIGYKPDFDKKKGKKKSGEKNYLNYFRKTVHSSNPYAHCNYCNRKGHTTSSCFHKKERKDKPVGNYQWLPKGTYVLPKARTNSQGPNYKRVPKCPSSVLQTNSGRENFMKKPRAYPSSMNRSVVPTARTAMLRQQAKEVCFTSRMSYHGVPFNYLEENKDRRFSHTSNRRKLKSISAERTLPIPKARQMKNQ